MKQVTLRLPDELAADLRREATHVRRSVNALVTDVLRARLDPDAEGEEIERLRAKLRRAGLLAEFEPTDAEPPTEAELADARRTMSGGKQLSDYVSEGRGPR